MLLVDYKSKSTQSFGTRTRWFCKKMCTRVHPHIRELKPTCLGSSVQLDASCPTDCNCNILYWMPYHLVLGQGSSGCPLATLLGLLFVLGRSLVSQIGYVCKLVVALYFGHTSPWIQTWSTLLLDTLSSLGMNSTLAWTRGIQTLPHWHSSRLGLLYFCPSLPQWPW